jgi:hypothetical protein
MKDDSDFWISAQKAAERIRVKLGVSVGKAQKILSDAYASGEVRRSVAVGRINPVRTNDGEITYAENDISWTDLECWLNEHHRSARKSQTKRGAKPKTDWDAIKEAFLEKVKDDDWPNELNVVGWQTQANVEDWIMEMAARDKVGISKSTARRYAVKFLSLKGQ